MIWIIYLRSVKYFLLKEKLDDDKYSKMILFGDAGKNKKKKNLKEIEEAEDDNISTKTNRNTNRGTKYSDKEFM